MWLNCVLAWHAQDFGFNSHYYPNQLTNNKTNKIDNIKTGESKLTTRNYLFMFSDCGCDVSSHLKTPAFYDLPKAMASTLEL